jgi:formylglycine-generating enzyme required for sulfatase activity
LHRINEKRNIQEIPVSSLITLQGIDQALSSLNYRNKATLKCRLISHIRGFYEDEGSVQTLRGIDPDELIKSLWNTGDDQEQIRNKRRNLNSIKSLVNADLKNLFDDGKNSEGINIGSNNIFEMSDEAREKFLQAFADNVPGGGLHNIEKISEVLTLVNDMLSDPGFLEDPESSVGQDKLEELKKHILSLSEKVGLEDLESADLGVEKAIGDLEDDVEEEALEEAEIEEELEETEIVEDEELDEPEIVEDLEEAEAEDDVEDAEVEEDLEETEIVEDEELDEPEIVEDLEEAEAGDDVEDAEVEEELEDTEIVEDEELEEPEIVEDLEEAEVEDDVEEEDVEEELEVAGEEDDDGLGAEELAGDLEEAEEIGGEEELSLPEGDIEEFFDNLYDDKKKIEKAKLLADDFDKGLGDMERFYNRFIMIQEGEYVVGGKQPKKDERTEQVVHLLPFYLGKFPVTNALFEIFIEKTGYRTTAEKLGYGTVYYGRCRKIVDEKTGLEKLIWNSSLVNKTVKGACWYQPLGPGSTLHQKRNHPLVQVSLEDAMAFAAWTGKRLPTEDEWEAAARTFNNYPFPWGNEWKKDSCNTEETYAGDTTPVDRYIEFENDFGIADTLGNVLEWTMTRSGSPSSGKNDSRHYIVKGGSWVSGKDMSLCTRFTWEPESHSNILGFRCVAF